MRTKSSRLHSDEYEEFGFRVQRNGLPSAGGKNPDSADDVIGEMGLVLIAILGIVVAINMMLTSLHVS